MLLTMTDNELLRIKVIQDICDKRLTGVEAAHLLNLSPRQVYRLVKRFIEFGASGLVSLQRGRPGNHRYDENVKLQTLAILYEHYTDFGPTLAHEKLTERHNIHVSVETIRQWMIADGLWVPHNKRKPRVYQPRYRRDWFDDRS
ncbi:helix-turn-helix domain-containing protein [Photobacterium damselae]|uniref:helix-turn-helix domain-containing protein n=1 Tax=Photobacterium damselae TaxID=38293 RepID=UPI0020919C5F|nr:helix-turn-helix domain-containing protein [Photobacterium damselae]USR76010.1 helix-turn-helix domain-containing protein [Photobacterium damselae]